MNISHLTRGRFVSTGVHSLLLVIVALAVIGSAIPVFRAYASNPTSGTLAPTATAPVTWRGTAPGGVGNDPLGGEDLCQEGINCDTFTLTIGGAPADWTGKKARIEITWLTPATDYDMYIHKDSNAGPTVATSAGGPTTSELAEIEPSELGTGVYTVRVVYFAGGGPADQYNGTASVVTASSEEQPPVVTGPQSCIEPGTFVVADPPDESPTTTANPQLDLLSLSIAEPPDRTGIDDPVTFAIGVSELTDPPAANGRWAANFRTPDGLDRYVDARSDANGNVTYAYGRRADPTGMGNGNSLTTEGAAQGRFDVETKTFFITVARANIANPNVGQTLINVFGQTQQSGEVVFLGIDSTEQKTYTIVGNAACGTSTPGPTPTPVSRISTEKLPTFDNLPAPDGLGTSAGEPTLGVNWETGRIMFIAGLQTLQITLNECTSPVTALWRERSAPNTEINTFDPILNMDNDTGNGAGRTNRTFVSQLIPGRGQSFFAFTDNDGGEDADATNDYNVNPMGGGINSGVDHQTVGSGPYARNPNGSLKGGAVQTPGLPFNSQFPGGVYPNAVYYASQDIALASLARSDDGGFNFGAAVPMYTLADCSGLHGHVKVAQDGTIYVPNKGCTGQQAVIVSEDNGATFDVRRIPGSTPGRTDPSVGIGAPDPATGIAPIYVGYTASDGHPHIAVSKDKGLTFTDDYDAGEPFGIKLSVFPAVAAGDHDRAAFFFLGTASAGSGTGDDSGTPFAGTWFGYIATTYDYGKTWAVVQATGKDPVQQGVICTNGTTCPSGTRNLLDFNDLTIDAKGRAVAAFADGCISAGCVNGVDKDGDGKLTRFDNDGTDLGIVIRQSSGKTLKAAFDNEPAFLASPLVDATFNPETNVVRLTFQPITNDPPVTGYKVFRTKQGGSQELLATLPANATSYDDTDPGATPLTNGYRVAAFTGPSNMPTAESGQGVCAITVMPRLIESSCELPGVTVARDSAGDTPAVTAVPSLDLQTVSVSEPFNPDGKNRVTFSLKVASLATPPVNGSWFIVSNRQVPIVGPAPMTGRDRNYVAMKANGGVITYEYGEVTEPSGNSPMRTGDSVTNPDIISGMFTSDGLISITVVNDPVLENVQPGGSISGIYGETFAQPNPPVITRSSAFDLSGDGLYQLVGSAACATPTVDEGIEGDVAPRASATGDGEVDTTDVAQTQRYSVGRDMAELAMSNNRQRADTAPRATFGDGVVDTTDVAQTQRYAVGRDGDPRPAAGPNPSASPAPPPSFASAAKPSVTPQGPPNRIVRVVNVTTNSNPNMATTVDVPIELETPASEVNGIGFSLNFDPAVLTNPIAMIGTARSQQTNSSPSLGQSDNADPMNAGRKGISLLLPIDETYPAGTSQIVVVRFTVPQGTGSGTTPVMFGDTPTRRSVSNANVDVITDQYTFQNGTVTIINPTAESATVGGTITDGRGRGVSGVRVTLTGSVQRTAITDRRGRFEFTDLANGEAFTLRAAKAGFRFSPASRTVTTEGSVQQGTADFSAQTKRRRTFGTRPAEK